MKKLTLAFCVLTFGSSMVYAATDTEPTGDATAGKAKAAACTPCHGADGNGGSLPSWPKLAGQHPSYLVKQLQAFKAKDRKEPLMVAPMVPLTEQDIYNLAAFFASQPKTKSAAPGDKLLELGQKIYRGGNKDTKAAACIACHGPSGLGNPAANYPTVNGQQAAYAKKQLMDFKRGTRNKGNAAIMRDIAIKMSEEEMEAVANYMQGM